MRLRLALFLGVLLCASTASAGPVTWVFTGPLTAMGGGTQPPPPELGWPMGDPFTWTITIDPTTQPLSPPVSAGFPCIEGAGFYPAVTSSTLQIGNNVWHEGPGFFGMMEIGVNAGNGACSDFPIAIRAFGMEFPEPNQPGVYIGPMVATLWYPGLVGGVPTLPPPTASLVWNSGHSLLGATDMTVAVVPEPGTLILVGTGAAALIVRARRRRSR